jgi:diguanylate cyclase (GGDEF)-like protein
MIETKMELNPQLKEKNLTDLLSLEQIDSAWPLLDVLPFPVTVIDINYMVVRANQEAVHEYSHIDQPCYKMSHGYDSPCNENGETCPKLDAQTLKTTISHLHIHQTNSGPQKFKVMAMPMDNGGAMEMHIPLDDVTSLDGVTGLTNRAEGEQGARRLVALMQRLGTPYSVIMLDLDYFKKINDQHGHHVGDIVLRRTAEVMAESIRASDILVRWGGEEFLMILSGAQSEHAAKFTKTLLDAIRHIRIELRDETLSVSASAGIRAVSSEELSHTNFDSALKHADLMLYAAKNAGRDQFMSYESMS